MDPVVIRDQQAGASAHILAELGFNCYAFRAPAGGELVDMIDAVPGFETGDKPASGSGIPILFPFPNRIRQGRFHWAGKDYQIPELDRQGNAIHGFVLDRPWRITAQGENFVVGEFQLSLDAPDRFANWPADFIIQIRYEIQQAVLRCHMRLENPCDVPLPWGLGTHPYFRMPLSDESGPGDCLVEVPAQQSWELVESLPTGKKVPVTGPTDLRDGRSLEGRPLDDIFTTLKSGNHVVETLAMDARAGLQISQRSDVIFQECVVFMPPGRRSVCLEPYTCVTDAINLDAQGIDAGWRILQPGEELQTWVAIELSRIYA